MPQQSPQNLQQFLHLHLCHLLPSNNIRRGVRRNLSPALHGSRDPAILANPPEVEDHQQARQDGEKDAMQHIKPEQGRGAHDRPAQEKGSGIVPWRHADDLGEGTLVTQQRRRPGHVGPHGDCPDRQLVPGEQVPGEGQEQRQREEDDAHDPVELPGRLVGTGHKDPKHVQPYGEDHAVGRPPMHVAQEHAEGDVELQILHVGVRILGHRPVIEHQDDACDREDQEEEKGDPPHAPGKPDADGMAPDFRRMEMHPDVRHDL